MPQVTMPDGTQVDMPDKLSPEMGQRLRAFQAAQQRGAKAQMQGRPAFGSALKSLGVAAARPVAEVAAGTVGTLTDLEAKYYNTLSGGRLRLPTNAQATDQALIDKYLPIPDTKMAKAAEDASEFVLGAMGGGAKDVDYAAERAADLARSAYRASQYVETRTGLKWGQLPGALQQKLMAIAKNPKDLAKLDPREIETHAGQTLLSPQLDRQLATLTGQIEKGLERPGKKPVPLAGKTPLQRGKVVQGTLAGRMKSVRGRVDKLFTQARQAGEMEAPADIQPLLDWMRVPENARYAGQWLRQELAPYVRFEEEHSEATPDPALRSLNTRVGPVRDPNAPTETQARLTKRVTINDLERIRGEANKRAFSKDQMDRSAFYARQARDVIDQVLDRSGSIYARARAGYRLYKSEWFRQRAINELTSNMRGTSDPKVAAEDVFQHAIVNGSAADVGKVKAALGNTIKGRQAWAELQAGAIDYLREGARPQPGAASHIANRFLSRLHDLDKNGKLDVLFGPDAADQVRAMAKTVHNVRGEEAAGRGQEDAGRIIENLARAISWMPGLGHKAHAAAGAYRVLATGARAVRSGLGREVKEPGAVRRFVRGALVHMPSKKQVAAGSAATEAAEE